MCGLSRIKRDDSHKCYQNSSSIIRDNTIIFQMFAVIWLQKNLPYRSSCTPCWKSLIITTLAFIASTKNK